MLEDTQSQLREKKISIIEHWVNGSDAACAERLQSNWAPADQAVDCNVPFPKALLSIFYVGTYSVHKVRGL